MPWCPKCHSEYDEGIETCYDCACELVDELPLKKTLSEEDTIREAFLMTVADETEFLVVESKLKEYGIPVGRRHREGGDFAVSILGTSRLGMDVYVPESASAQAREIIEMGVGQLPRDQESDENTAKTKPSFFTVLLIVVAGYALINYISRLLD